MSLVYATLVGILTLEMPSHNSQYKHCNITNFFKMRLHPAVDEGQGFQDQQFQH